MVLANDLQHIRTYKSYEIYVVLGNLVVANSLYSRVLEKSLTIIISL